MSDSNLRITLPELRLATLALCALSAALPGLYYLKTLLPPSSPPQHIRTFNAFLAAYNTLRPNALTANASASFTHTILPSSLNLPTRTLAPFKQHAGMIFSLFEDFNMVPQPSGSEPSESGSGVHFCPATNTVIANCKMGGRINGRSEKGRCLVEQGVEEWWSECVLFVRMDREGKKVVGVKEFVDSGKAGELRGRLEGVLG